MKKSGVNDISLVSYDKIFTDDEDRADELCEKVIDINLKDLHTFKNHPFHINDDDDMLEMVESIKQFGVLVPGIVRKHRNSGYEIIAGHRRKRASELAGKATMPVIIRNLDDDDATIIMVDSNLQRESLLPSEKAFSYKMKFEAIKHQGVKSTSTQVGSKLSLDIIAEEAGESRTQVQRYIRLTELIPPLLNMTDKKQIAFNAAVEISYIHELEQENLLKIIEKTQIFPSLKQTQKLKKYSQEGKLSLDVIDAILTEDKPVPKTIVFGTNKLKKYFPKDYTVSQMEQKIIEIVEIWAKNNNSSFT